MCCNYYVKFFIKGIPSFRQYKIVKDEQDRLFNLFVNSTVEEIGKVFYCFETVDGLSVCISIKDIISVQLLYENENDDKVLNNVTYNQDLLIKLRSNDSELIIETEEYDDLDNLIFSLNNLLYNNIMFVSVTDINGDVNLFNIEEIIYVEVCTSLLFSLNDD